jgi:hypothetical protein
MNVESRRLLHALIERTGARLDDFEARFEALERIVFELDDYDARLARLEQRPPPPLPRSVASGSVERCCLSSVFVWVWLLP